MEDTILSQKSICSSFRWHLASKVDHLRFSSKIQHNCFSLPSPSRRSGLRLSSQNDATKKTNMAIFALPPPEVPVSVDPSHSFWELITPSSVSDTKVWIVGSVVTLLLSFTRRGKWGPLLQMKDKAEAAIEEAEKLADVVEDVAEKVEKVAEAVAKNLPEGKLQDAAESVEKIAENIDKSAQMAEAALEKVENMEKKLEAFVESTTVQEKLNTTVQAKDQ